VQAKAEIRAGIKITGAHNAADSGNEDDSHHYGLQGNQPKIEDRDTERSAHQESMGDRYFLNPGHGFFGG
jgi:hypothetical protein